ncbi:MAG: VanZ family protein, partial [Chitinophagaceae bacterium]
MNKIKPSFIPAIAWLLLTLILLTLPGTAFPKENWFDKIWLDKWIHIGLFAVLAALWCWAFLKKVVDNDRLKTLFWKVGLVCLAYGTGME